MKITEGFLVLMGEWISSGGRKISPTPPKKEYVLVR
jgi:hypothetical protein